jgi:hypothetical protein
MELEIGDSDRNEIEIIEKPHYELENVVCFENDTKTPGKLVLSNLYVFNLFIHPNSLEM